MKNIILFLYVICSFLIIDDIAVYGNVVNSVGGAGDKTVLDVVFKLLKIISIISGLYLFYRSFFCGVKIVSITRNNDNPERIYIEVSNQNMLFSALVKKISVDSLHDPYTKSGINKIISKSTNDSIDIYYDSILLESSQIIVDYNISGFFFSKNNSSNFLIKEKI